MKVLLISANTCTEPYPVYPLALTYLATALRNEFNGIEIAIFDVNIDKDLAAFILRFNPDFTGISIRNIDNVNLYHEKNFVNDYRDLVKTVRSVSKSVIVVGGAGFSIYPQKLFSYLDCDFGVTGEG
ncbi:MAG TPA: cobalamin-dependent protein, partial [bacterium]|nr:cobalamin-dependent protein [bacterium]